MAFDPRKSDLRLREILKPTLVVGLGVGVLLFSSFLVWASLAPIGSAAIASGNVSPDSSRKVIQHLEGGIVRQINVIEGQRVEKGMVLVTLEPVIARAQHNARRQQWMRLQVVKARLEAHSSDTDKFEPPAFPKEEQDSAFASFVSTQASLFGARRKAYVEREQIFRQQIEQLKQQSEAKKRENESLGKQRGFLEAEIADKEELLAKNLARRPEWLALQRARADMMGRVDSNFAELGRIQERIGEVELSIATNRTQFNQEISDQLVKANAEIAQLEETMPATADILRRTDIVAPTDGTVLNLRFKTVGGVVKPGEAILDLVPLNDDLIIDARLSPNDIDVVHKGLQAEVYLTPYVSRHTPRLIGTVIHVGADITRDPASGSAGYFEVRIKIDKNELGHAKNITMTPGMPAEVYIFTGTRTFGQYIIDPLVKSFRRAFRED
jgi:HlyD family secretion protein